MRRFFAVPALLLIPLAAAVVPQAGPAPGPPPPDALDAVFFEDVVQPLLGASCASGGCHGTAGRAGALHILPPPADRPYGAEATLRNFEAVRTRLASERPRESPILRKLLPPGDGGLPHRSHRTPDRSSPIVAAIERFARGERVTAPRPIADAGSDRFVKTGETVRLDASGSRNRGDGPLALRFDFASRPEGSSAALDDPVSRSPSFAADVAGAYVLVLHARGPRGDAAPDTVRVVADSSPVVSFEAEDGRRRGAIDVVRDPGASGELAVAAGGPDGEGTVECAFHLPEDVEAGLWISCRGAGDPRSRVTIAIDGEPAAEVIVPGGPAFVFAPVASAAGLRVRPLAGSWREMDDDGVTGDSPGETLAACRLDVPLDAGTASAVVALERFGGRMAGAFFLYGVRSASDFRFVGIERGGAAVTLGRVTERGEERLGTFGLERALEPGFHHMRLRLGAERLTFALDGEIVAEDRLDVRSPREGGSIGLAVRGGVVRFEELDVRRGDDALVDLASAGAEGPGVFALSRGPHRASIAIRGPGTVVDRVLVAPPGAAADLDPKDLRFIRRVHFDLLGRPPDELETLAAAAEGRDRLAARLVRAPGFAEEWYERELYYFLLIDNFRPSGGRFASLPVRLHRDELTFPEAVREIVASAPFSARNPGPDTFVTVVLEQLNGVRVQDAPKVLEAGKRLYDGYDGTFLGRPGRSQSDVVRIATEDESFRRRFVSRLAAALFDSAPPDAELSAAAKRIHDDPAAVPDIVRGFLLSGRYAAELSRPRRKSERQYVRALFLDVAGREPSYEELRDLRNAFLSLADSGPLRAVIARVVLDSETAIVPAKDAVADPERFVRASFVRFLGRRPTEAEIAAFVSGWADPALSPRTVWKALVGLPDYQTY